jgi:hypothetical protein
MMSSGLNVPTPAMLMPAFAVPYAAPMAIVSQSGSKGSISTGEYHLHVSVFHNGSLTAAATPPNPMNGAVC